MGGFGSAPVEFSIKICTDFYCIGSRTCVLLTRAVDLCLLVTVYFDTYLLNSLFQVYAKQYIIIWHICILFFHGFCAFSFNRVDLLKQINQGCVLECV